MAPVYTAKPAKLPKNTYLVSNKISFQHSYSYILPSISAPTPTTSTYILPAGHACLPSSQVTLPVHMEHEAVPPEKSYEELVQFRDIWYHAPQSD